MTTDPDQRAFLEAIAAAPDDDTPRLVYADWLDEHDRAPAADAIRRGVANPERFTFGPGESAQIAYRSPRADLYSHVSVTLAAGYADVQWTTYKGLIESAMCSWERWLAVGDGLLKRNWCPEVVLTTTPDLERVGGWVTGGHRTIWKIPGRTEEHAVLLGDDRNLVVLVAEWPAVKRWMLPKLMDYRELDILVMPPRIGSVVRLADGSEGVLLGAIDGNGYGVVRPLATEAVS